MFRIHFSIERWRYNKEFEIYVSNKGHFRNREKKDIPIKIGNGGYCMVYCGGNIHKYLSAHRVVMLTWRPTANAENLTVDHLDHNKRNNALENLEWVTQEENTRRAKADLISVKVEGAPEMVEKVDISVITKRPKSKYDYYLKLNEAVVLSVEEFAILQWKYIGRGSVCPSTKKLCANVEEFCEAINYKVASLPSWDGKLYGFQCELIMKGE
jgi:hypothetical protein